MVDEYQDTDPAQEQVLQALARTGAQLVVVGDPDQSIYAFRGADVRGILEFPRGFAARAAARPGGSRWACRRSGPELVAASRRGGADAAAGAAGGGGRRAGSCSRWAPTADTRRCPSGCFPSPAQEAVAVADVLRRAHLIDGCPWRSMAVLVRSTRSAGPLQRALADAGVPVETPTDERPLVREPALEPLLTLLRLALSGAAGRGHRGRPARLAARRGRRAGLLPAAPGPA